MELSEYIRKACIANVKLIRPFLVAQTGALVFSSHHLHFASNTQAAGQDGRSASENGVRCLCMMRLVDTLEQVSVVNLRVRLRDFDWFELEFPNADDCANAVYTISKLSRIDVVELTFPFFYVADFEQLDDGWAAFSTDREFAAITKGDPNWRLSEVNVDYAACPSYPRHCVVPANVPDSVLLASSYFRAGSRFPVVAYVHERGSMKEGRRFVPLIRASQPLVGPSGRRSGEDESLLRSILNGAQVGYVVDTRTNGVLRNASQRGGGCEIESYYTGWRPECHGVVDSTNAASALSDALQRFIDVTNDVQINASKYLSKLDASGWPRLVRDALASAVRIAALLDDEGAPVLLHGADGTDSTLLISSLTQMLLSSASRTLRGFAALIDREFVQGGYPFSERAATSPVTVASSNNGTNVYQATFLLFLDCVWQLTQQLPTVFEFNEQLLLFLAQQSMASEFGTFLVNNERERQRLSLAERTVSIWSFVLSSSGTKRFTNAFFSAFHDPLKPCCAPSSYSIWMDLYQRCVFDLREHHAARDHFAQLKRDYDALRVQYTSICIKRQRAEPSAENSSVDSSDFEKINVSA